MDAARTRRLAERIGKIVAEMLERRIKDPRLGFVTVTETRLTSDWREATVFYTVYGSEEERAETAAALRSATGVIRLEKVMLGGGPGPNRVLMGLKAQMFIGERWELVFVKDALSVRAYTSAPLKHEFYHVEFPPAALWIF